MAKRLNENTELAMPIRNLIGLVTAATVGTWAYFSLVERLNSIDNKIILMEADLDQNSEFRTKWPRGEMGSLPADQEQYLLLENLANQFEKLQILIESGRAPQDQQQALTLDFFEKRLTNIETQIEKLRNGRGSGN
tara:strand:- start:1012 stop:1419 length:408 start_codon:yes stop_codon:yes gene_type:complete